MYQYCNTNYLTGHVLFVYIFRRIDRPPNLGQITQLQNQYKDDVPLTWAVVESGDVAFYTFSNITLPVDITMG